tara:strand:- start:176 stop:499 length:324 start_codon:yes stop_codon:yes gene_type:complete
MSLITLLDGIPLYSTKEDAIAWGESLGITGSHTHIFEGQTGYMAGGNHQDIELILNELGASASEDSEGSSVITSAPVESLTVTTTTTTTPTTTTTSTGGGSSSGGGY